MEPKPKVGIIVVAYNNPDFIIPQTELFRKYCADAPEIIVIDNSTDLEASEAIKYHAGQLGVEYTKTNASSSGGSESHSFAANFAYMKYKDSYNYLFWADHDLFAVKAFSIPAILGDKVIAGLGQEKSGKKYFWGGCVMLNNTIVDKSLVDFYPNMEYGMDTGGNLYRIIAKYGEENCVFFNEAYHQNPNFRKSFYNFYSMINNEMFFHCLNGSNWSGSNDDKERINSLLSILNERTI